MVTYLAGNRLFGTAAQMATLASNSAAALLDGTVFYQDGTNDAYIWDATSDEWKLVSVGEGNTANVTETFTKKTFDDHITMQKVSAVGNQATNYGAIYIDTSDGKLYFKYQSNTAVDLTLSASSVTLSGLSDTVVSSPASGHVLVYDGTNSWDNKAISGDIALASTGAVTIQAGAVEGTMLNANVVDDSSIELASNTLNVKALGVTNAMLEGSIADSKLLQLTSSNKVAGSAVQLASTSALENSTGLRIKAATAGAGLAIASQVLSVGVDDSSIEINSDVLRVKSGGITNDMLDNSSITVSDGSNTSPVELGGTLTFAAASATQITVAESAGTVTIGLPNNVTIAGNLTVTGNHIVNGTTTTISTTNLAVEDSMIALAAEQTSGNGTNALDVGLYGTFRTGTTTTYTGLFRDVSDGNTWKFFDRTGNSDAVPGTTVDTTSGFALADVQAKTFIGEVTGTASSATVLANSRDFSVTGDVVTASAVVFNGSGNVALNVSFNGAVIVNADIAANAAIVDSKLDTISTADKVSGAAIQVDGATDGTGITVANATKLLVDDGGATKYINASQLNTYIGIPSSVTVADTTDTTSFVALFESATGNLAPKTDASNLTYNATTGALAAALFTGSVTVSGDTLTTSAAQNLAIVQGMASNADIGAYDFRAQTLTADGLTATRVVFAGTNGVLSDDSDLTFATDTLSATKTKTVLVDSGGANGLDITATGSAVNYVTITNAAGTDAPLISTKGTATNAGLSLSGKGTGGVILTNATANGAFLEFDTKAAPADPSDAEQARLYLKEVDSNNNALAVKIQKAGAIVEVEITSPKAVCGQCGSTDGASDPTYDFSRGIMILDLWCGHSYEVPMQGSYIDGNR